MGSGKGAEGNSLANGLSASIYAAVGPWGGYFGLRSIHTGGVCFELPALICPNL